MGFFGRKSKPKEVTIDYDKLAEAIVKANKLIKENEQNLILKQKEQETKEWNEVMGYKIYPDNESKLKKTIHFLRNNIVTSWNYFNLDLRKVKGDAIVFSLMQLIISWFFALLKFVFYCGALIFLSIFILSFTPICSMPIWSKIALPVIIVFMFLYGKIFRLAACEINNMTDRQYIVGLFSGFSAFLALVVAIISLVVAVIK